MKHDPKIWGPPLWAKLHATADVGALSPQLVAMLAHRIPCTDCLHHWQRIVRACPLDMTNQREWAIKVHNAVNALLGKPKWKEPAA